MFSGLKNKFSLNINNLILLIPFLLGIAIWWNKDLFSPGSYYNAGDTAFALIPSKSFYEVYFAWVDQGLGRPNLFSAFIPAYLIKYLLSLIFIPVWIINRLWLIIPTAMVGWGTYYLYRSIFKDKTSRICGTIAACFAMLPTLYDVIPVWYIALSGCPLVLGGLIRGLHKEHKSWKHSLVISIGFLFLTLNPRYFYLTCWVSVLYVIFSGLLDRKIFTRANVLWVLKTGSLFLVVNAFWIIPLIYYSVTKNSALGHALASSAYGKQAHREMLLSYKNLANPIWIMRLMVGGNFGGLSYIKQGFIYPLTFIMPLYVFMCVLFKGIKKNERFLPLTLITVILLIFACALYYPWTFNIYLYLWENFPGFVILNNPSYWISIIGILYAVLTGATTAALLNRIESNKKYDKRKQQVFKAMLLTVLLSLFGLVYGGALLVGINPKETVWGRSIYMNHIGGAKIPQEYFDLKEDLGYNEKYGHRVLNLPKPFEGYPAYTWWHDFTMMEVINFLSPIPVLGASNVIEKPVAEMINLMTGHNPDSIVLMKKLGVKFILLHKDYYRIPHVFGYDDEGVLDGFLSKNDSFILLKENDLFKIYILKDEVMPCIYALTENDSELIKVDYKKMSPTKYVIDNLDIDNCKIVLNQEFHALWELSAADLKVKDHTKTVEGMNVWQVQKAKNKRILIVFKAQKWVDTGLLFTCIGLVTFGVIKKKKALLNVQ